MVNENIKDSEFTLAVANLAVAAMKHNPKLTMGDAVAAARDTLRGTVVSSKQILESVKNDKIQCLDDGTWHIMLRGYIRRHFNMTPEQYRKKWGLANDYPMVAPAYSMKRSKIAKKNGFGKKSK